LLVLLLALLSLSLKTLAMQQMHVLILITKIFRGAKCELKSLVGKKHLAVNQVQDLNHLHVITVARAATSHAIVLNHNGLIVGVAVAWDEMGLQNDVLHADPHADLVLLVDLARLFAVVRAIVPPATLVIATAHLDAIVTVEIVEIVATAVILIVTATVIVTAIVIVDLLQGKRNERISHSTVYSFVYVT